MATKVNVDLDAHRRSADPFEGGVEAGDRGAAALRASWE